MSEMLIWGGIGGRRWAVVGNSNPTDGRTEVQAASVGLNGLRIAYLECHEVPCAIGPPARKRVQVLGVAISRSLGGGLEARIGIGSCAQLPAVEKFGQVPPLPDIVRRVQGSAVLVQELAVPALREQFQDLRWVIPARFAGLGAHVPAAVYHICTCHYGTEPGRH